MDLIERRRRETGAQAGDLLSLLIAASAAEGKSGGLTDDELVSDAFIFFLAGHETTSTALLHAVTHLAWRRDLQDRAFEEATAALGTTDMPRLDDHKRLPLCEAIIKESLRLH